MKLSRFYQLIVKFGRQHDPRKIAVKSYEDTAILYGSPETQINKILVGIEIEVPELLLADRIRQVQGLDLAMAHHPEGRAYASLYEVMRLHVDILESAGLNRRVAEKLLDERMQEVERRILPQNHARAVDAARLLDMPFMCCHTPADNQVYWFVKQLMEKEKPKTLQDIVKVLMDVAEYQEAVKINAGPRIISGSPGRQAGKILVEMTGGTEGSKDVFDKLYKAGIRTIICMHLSEEHFKKVKDANLNVVIAGHISSDTLGLNLLLDKIEKEESLQIINCSGFKRIRRSA